MKDKVKRAVKYLQSINSDGENILLGKRLYNHINNLDRFISKQARAKDKLKEIEMGLNYFFEASADDNRWTITVDAATAIEDILYGVYLTAWYRDHDEGEPVDIYEFLDVDYFYLIDMI